MSTTPLPNVYLVAAGTIRSFPEAIAKTGTITSTGTNVIGTGTLFLTEIRNPNNPGVLMFSYILNTATGEIREILSVNSATHLVLKNAFASDVSGQALFVVNNYFLHSISIVPLGDDVEMFTPESASTVIADHVEVSIKDNNGIPPIGLNCVADTQVLTD